MKNLPDGTIASLSEMHILTLYNKEGEVVGEVDFSGKSIVFDGNIHESADKLFYFLKKIVDPFFKR
ncbi:MAG TPA: hypothetical protein VMV86_02945 [Methanosarcinales archaeon]|nr:hypothetical protein [Methanosarcinales archaeon]